MLNLIVKPTMEIVVGIRSRVEIHLHASRVRVRARMRVCVCPCVCMCACCARACVCESEMSDPAMEFTCASFGPETITQQRPSMTIALGQALLKG